MKHNEISRFARNDKLTVRNDTRIKQNDKQARTVVGRMAAARPAEQARLTLANKSRFKVLIGLLADELALVTLDTLRAVAYVKGEREESSQVKRQKASERAARGRVRKVGALATE